MMNQEQLNDLLQILWEGYEDYEMIINIRALIDALEALKHGEEYNFYENISALNLTEIEHDED